MFGFRILVVAEVWVWDALSTSASFQTSRCWASCLGSQRDTTHNRSSGACRSPADRPIFRYLAAPVPGMRQSCGCTLAPASDMDRKAAAIDRTDGRTDIRPLHRPYTAYHAGSINNSRGSLLTYFRMLLHGYTALCGDTVGRLRYDTIRYEMLF